MFKQTRLFSTVRVASALVLPLGLMAGCAGGPDTGADVGYVSDEGEVSACEATGGELVAPRAGATCGTQEDGANCIWSPMAVSYEAQVAEADCDGRACACVTQGDIHASCAATAPTCSCMADDLFSASRGCMPATGLDTSFAEAKVADLVTDGVYVMYRPGAIDQVAHYADFEALLAAHPYLSFGLTETCTLKRGAPAHDCDADFGEAVGCYVSVTQDYTGVSQRMADLETYAEQHYGENARTAAAAHEADVVATVVVTEAHLALHFGRDDDGWHLLVIDATAYDCGA